MVDLIVFIIFVVSLAALLLLLYKKIPYLLQLPQNGDSGFKKHQLVVKVEKKIKDFHFDFFKKQVFLHKFLSRCRVLILKIEKKIDEYLHGIRKKAQELEKQNKGR